ncbi:NmrA family NAD(P)-binding protein [Sinorhizobium medicae]|uniref:NmrA family NAD(P)-binding protein n=1 Tax=Sinorhizobium medicae TaxID=110321 RepID=UPI0003A47D10|nr:NAD(P)H-binding protein [Sinorhizobium medicae]
MVVVAMSRKGAAPDERADVEWVRVDMMDPESLHRALQGVDVVVSSANSYMKGSLDTDFQGNKNLIEAAARAGVGRFVFLSIVSCEAASAVPHFHAKKVAEDLIKASGMPIRICARALIPRSELGLYREGCEKRPVPGGRR